MNYYGKTILSCYNTLDSVCEQIERTIKKKAKNSFYDTSNTYLQMDALLKLNEVRIDLMNLKDITEETLNKLSEEDKTLLSFKYFKVVPSYEFDHTSRNYFRKQVKAIERFNKALENYGLSEEEFFKKYMSVAFIKETYYKTVNEEGKKHVI